MWKWSWYCHLLRLKHHILMKSIRCFKKNANYLVEHCVIRRILKRNWNCCSNITANSSLMTSCLFTTPGDWQKLKDSFVGIIQLSKIDFLQVSVNSARKRNKKLMLQFFFYFYWWGSNVAKVEIKDFYVLLTVDFSLISIKIMKILKFLFTRNRVFKHKEVFSNLHVCSNGFGKIWASYIFHFSTRILTSTHKKEFNAFFRIIYAKMSNNQISTLDNVKMTCQTHKY